MPVNQRFDQLTAVQLVIVVGIVHLEVVELQLLLGHLARIERHIQMLGNMPANSMTVRYINFMG